jgi:hypothetical protein
VQPGAHLAKRVAAASACCCFGIVTTTVIAITPSNANAATIGIIAIEVVVFVL